MAQHYVPTGLRQHVPCLRYLVIVVASVLAVAAAEDGSRYTNVWAVQLLPGTSELEAREIAIGVGFSSAHLIIRRSTGDIYLFEHSAEQHSPQPNAVHHDRLKRSLQVVWAEQQVAKVRVKRDLHFNDPNLPDSWYLNKGAYNGYDLNVHAAWEHGYSGKGAVITILDDGLEWKHPDIRANYDPEASADINNSTRGHVDGDPTPRYDYTNENRHGTRCAGEVAAVANNGVCSVGVAFGSKIGGVRMLDGDVTDAVEAQSLRLNIQHIDIYSASWGPDDNGRTVDGPGSLAKAAFVEGVEKGRGGKGSIFVWASGNGGLVGDSCACDGYTNSLYTLSVSSTSEANSRPWYLEECASTITTTYSSGSNYGNQRQIVTTDLNGQCTKRHTGTSASAPLAAAVVALTLEANPNLTWRDVQYIMVMSSNPLPLTDGQWQTNGVGRKFSHLYGYGLVDAFAAVQLAKNWTTVPSRYEQALPAQASDAKFDARGFSSTIRVPACPRRRTSAAATVKAPSDNCIRFLEHVQLVTTVTYSRRGDLKIILKSPAGTESVLLPPRSADHYEGSFNGWPFMSVHFWGESPAGDWTVELRDVGQTSVNHGHLSSYQLVLHGTAENPLRGQPVEVKCHAECQLPCDGLGAGQCDFCKHYRMGHDGPCVETCPSKGYFVDDDSDDAASSGAPAGICVACSTDCMSCEGPLPGDCVACKPGLVLDSTVSHQCVVHCPPTTWPDPESGECKPCVANCSSCRDGVTCLSCLTGYTWHEAKAACLERCTSGRYYELSSSSCQLCDPRCQQCTGPSSVECSSCPVATYLLNGTCGDSCPPGYFAHHQLCEKCHDSCRTCNAADDNNCRSCEAGHLLTDHGQCVVMPSCSKGYFVDSITGTCSPCHASCESCNGNASDDCLSCSSPWLQFGTECVKSCPKGHFEQTVVGSTSRLCTECNASECIRCTGNTSSDCTECDKSYSLSRLTGCVRLSCPPSMYPSSANKCQPCHHSCAECVGPSDNDCRSCKIGVLLADGKCVLNCPAGSYGLPARISSTAACSSCHSTCQTCSGPANSNCLSCEQGMVLKNSKCIVPPVCHAKQYLDKGTQECLSCDVSCASCTGPSPNECTTCPAYLHFYRLNHTCVVCCSPEIVNVQCCQCSSSPSGMACNLAVEPTTPVGSDAGDSNDGGQPGGVGSHRQWLIDHVTLYVIIVCFILTALYVVVFGLLQAKSNHWLCWSGTPAVGARKGFAFPVSLSSDVLYSQVQIHDDDHDDTSQYDSRDETKLVLGSGERRKPQYFGSGRALLEDED